MRVGYTKQRNDRVSASRGPPPTLTPLSCLRSLLPCARTAVKDARRRRCDVWRKKGPPGRKRFWRPPTSRVLRANFAKFKRGLAFASIHSSVSFTSHCPRNEDLSCIFFTRDLLPNFLNRSTRDEETNHPLPLFLAFIFVKFYF